MQSKPNNQEGNRSRTKGNHRFQVLQLEERIAPASIAIDYVDGFGRYYGYTKGHYNPHGKWVGHGGRRY